MGRGGVMKLLVCGAVLEAECNKDGSVEEEEIVEEEAVAEAVADAKAVEAEAKAGEEEEKEVISISSSTSSASTSVPDKWIMKNYLLKKQEVNRRRKQVNMIYILFRELLGNEPKYVDRILRVHDVGECHLQNTLK
jgi:hypothetical protein